MERELQWWKGQLAADIHQSLRIKELKLPVYRAHSPQIGMRRYFADLLAILSNRYQLCPTARHLAVYLLDLQSFMVMCSQSSCHFKTNAYTQIALNGEGRPGSQTGAAELSGLYVQPEPVLNKKDLIKMELLLLETFGWNLCMPTPAHFIDYYLHASVQEGDLYNGWPLSSLSKTKAFMDKYTHYFLEVSLQDHAFLSFRPSQVAAACVAASRICLQISPSWTTALHLLTGYTWEHLTQCIELMLLAHDNDVKEANKTKSTPPHRPSSLQSQPQTSHLSPMSAIQRPASSTSSSTSSTPQLLFQPDSFAHLTQHSPSLSQLQALADSQALGPMVNMSQDFLQSHRMGLLTGASSMTPGGGFPSYPSLTSGLQPGARALPLQGPISVQMALAGEPRHCLSMAYSGGYLGSHHTFTAGCFDRPPLSLRQLRYTFSLSNPSSQTQRRLKRKQRSKCKTDPVEIITLTQTRRKTVSGNIDPTPVVSVRDEGPLWVFLTAFALGGVEEFTALSTAGKVRSICSVSSCLYSSCCPWRLSHLQSPALWQSGHSSRLCHTKVLMLVSLHRSKNITQNDVTGPDGAVDVVHPQMLTEKCCGGQRPSYRVVPCPEQLPCLSCES
ncbi:hypothetical protein F7725_009985 [Dissostichus mawsoni]|uniref:Cyclin C-terminal domain-containing protein n=1 Tax=Dissostichus mawsoni TaxID=36200 RepID=A0A7J5XNQ8_DISMA|nr:hypothetical protein F7725_009985 [Dissostichus mawsoni]